MLAKVAKRYVRGRAVFRVKIAAENLAGFHPQFGRVPSFRPPYLILESGDSTKDDRGVMLATIKNALAGLHIDVDALVWS